MIKLSATNEMQQTFAQLDPAVAGDGTKSVQCYQLSQVRGAMTIRHTRAGCDHCRLINIVSGVASCSSVGPLEALASSRFPRHAWLNHAFSSLQQRASHTCVPSPRSVASPFRQIHFDRNLQKSRWQPSLLCPLWRRVCRSHLWHAAPLCRLDAL